MVSALIHGFALSNDPPVNVLPNGQNCVGMAFSRVLGIGSNATINLFISRRWIPNATALQFDNAIVTVVTGLPLQNRFLNVTWGTLKPQLSTLPDGRYFAVNSGVHDFGGQGSGHAFAIIKQHGSWGTFANNQEGSGYNYSSRITNGDHISVWGPS